MAEEAFPTDNINDVMTQRHLTDIFVDGIREDSIARKLIRDGLQTLDDAVRIAALEQQTACTFGLRRSNKEEPMDVYILSKNATLENKASMLTDKYC